MKLSEADRRQLASLNISVETFETQLHNFETGFPKLELVEPATVQRGIWKLTPAEIQKFEQYFQDHAKNFKMAKFVPASGMASRMFKEVYNFITTFDESEANYNSFIAGDSFKSIRFLIENLDRLPFYSHLSQVLKEQNRSLKDLRALRQFKTILKTIVADTGLGYGTYPKALLPFHTYKTGGQVFTRTALQDQLVETLHYLNHDKIIRVAFTIGEAHTTTFEQHLNHVKAAYENQYQTTFKLDYSFQASQTDIVAVDENNEPFRLKDGKLLFRKGGHGALLDNLNKCEADLIFIKNIDNIAHEAQQKISYQWKKILGGILMKVQTEIFSLIKRLEDDTIRDLDWVLKRLAKDYNIMLPESCFRLEASAKKAYLKETLKRPIRVCGMILDTGHAGGGPFWIKEPDGSHSLQIIEGAQIDKSDPKQVQILEKATHFSPVDIVFATKNYRGEAFNLLDYRDSKTGFITPKSLAGRTLKAQELPGLWNGSMANWISIFVEVPKETFTPVKTVNDLLKAGHNPR